MARPQLTRRAAARTLGAAVASLPRAAAQTPATAPDSTDPLTRRREMAQRTSQTLAKISVPTDVEPAFQFKA